MNNNDGSPEADGFNYNPSQKHFLRTMHRVIDESDVIVFVLDARDPEGCRNPSVEEKVRKREAEGKKFIFLLNKIDLVPKSNAEAWLRYLRNFAPTIGFRASTQIQREHISSKSTLGLLNLLKSYKTTSRTLVVGMLGYPNVGKSSVINSLKRSKVCAVGAEPGWTKDMQLVQIERGIKVLDSPGVIINQDSPNSQDLRLRNVLKMSDLEDPVSVAALIFERVSSAELHEVYKLPFQESPNFQQFLAQLAMASGRLLRGGVPDFENAARILIRDWNSQKLPYFTEVPDNHTSNLPEMRLEEDVEEAMVITGDMAPAFDIDALLEGNTRTEIMGKSDTMRDQFIPEARQDRVAKRQRI